MRALIVGLGSIGQRHLENLRNLKPSAHITVCRQFSKSLEEGQAAEADRVVYGLEDALDTKLDIALIASPTSLHVETALILAREGVHLFIEKPLSNTMKHVDELLDLCRVYGVVLKVGYNFRFYRPLQIMRQALVEGRIGRPLAVRAEVGHYLPDWRTTGDYEDGVSARQDLGGGALLELSHELDYVCWLMGEVRAVSAHIAHVSDLDIDVEDIAEIIMQFRNGALGSVHMDMFRRPQTRTCQVVGSDGTIKWDGLDHSVKLYSSRLNTWADLHPAQYLDRNEMYLAELREFLDCVAGNNDADVAWSDGKRVLEIAMSIKQSAQERRVVDL